LLLEYDSGRHMLKMLVFQDAQETHDD
jgi:hypothetical protein